MNGRFWLVPVTTVLALVPVLAACAGTPQPRLQSTQPVKTGVISLPSPTTPVAVAASSPEAVSTVITLTIWTPPVFSPYPEGGAAGHVLAGQLASFQEEHPNIHLDWLLKKPYGKGGVLDFLTTTRAAVPAAMPDLVALDTFELGEAARAGLLQPLDDLVTAELYDDLFPFARQAGLWKGHLVGLPFAADVEHLVFNTEIMSVAPRTWAELLESRPVYLFPAGGHDGLVNDAFLIQYLALGGRMVDEDGEPALDKALLTQVLEFYEAIRTAGVLSAQALELHDVEECWSAYRRGDAAIVHVMASRYLAEHDIVAGAQFAFLPTHDGQEITLSRSWSLALVTVDPARQEAARRLLEWLLAANNNAAWGLAAWQLPCRRSALEMWKGAVSAEHLAFLRRLLEVARYRPPEQVYMRMARALQRAVESVLTGSSTPEQAAAETLLSLGP